MPYITTDNKKPIDPEIAKLVKSLFLESMVMTPANGKYFFFRLLTVFYEELRHMIAIRTAGNKARYQHYNELDGAFGCAGKELFRRWGAARSLKMRIVDWNKLDARANHAVSQKNMELLREGVRSIIERFALTSCPSEDRLPAIMAQTVGEINYTISELANAFGNESRATHQELLNMVIAAPYFLNEQYCGPYENEAIGKNGDTAGFTKYFALHFSGPQKKS